MNLMQVFIFLVPLSAIVWWPVNSQTELFAYEGDKVFIPCCNTQGEDIVQWKIGGSTFSPISVSDPWPSLQLEATARGIVINSVSFDLIFNLNANAPHQNVSFECCTNDRGQPLNIRSTVVLTIGAKSEDRNNGRLQRDDFNNLHLRVTAGGTAYIPCDSGTELATIWEINGKLYTFLDLPLYHEQHCGGIIVSNISKESNGKKYKCYSTRMGNYHLHHHYTISIKVTSNSGTNTSQRLDYYNKRRNSTLIEIDSQTFLFNDETIKLYVRFRNEPEPVNCLQQGKLFLNINGTTIETRTGEFTLQNEWIENIFGEIYANSSLVPECNSRLPFDFRIKANYTKSCTQEGQVVCIVLPQDRMNTVVIFRSKPNKDKDCECALFLNSSNLSIQDCHCINEETYLYIMDDNNLCLTNLTNSTHILFAKDCMWKSKIFRTYVHTTEVIVQGPILQNPHIYLEVSNQDEDQIVRIESTTDAEKTSIVIRDITGDTVLDIINASISLKIPSSCTLHYLNATAYTYCTHSETTYFEVSRNPVGDICDCVKAKASFEIDVSLTLEVKISVRCHFRIYQVSNIYLEAEQDNNSVSVPIQVTCDQSVSLNLISDHEFTLAKNYEHISIVWKAQDRKAHDKPCLLMNKKGSANSIWTQNTLLVIVIFLFLSNI